MPMAGPISTDIEVAEFAGQLFFRLWRAAHTRTAEPLNSLGLTPALFALLNAPGPRDCAPHVGDTGEAPVERYERRIDELGQRNIARVIARQVAPQPPRPPGQDFVRPLFDL